MTCLRPGQTLSGRSRCPCPPRRSPPGRGRHRLSGKADGRRSHLSSSRHRLVPRSPPASPPPTRLRQSSRAGRAARDRTKVGRSRPRGGTGRRREGSIAAEAHGTAPWQAPCSIGRSRCCAGTCTPARHRTPPSAAVAPRLADEGFVEAVTASLAGRRLVPFALSIENSDAPAATHRSPGSGAAGRPAAGGGAGRLRRALPLTRSRRRRRPPSTVGPAASRPASSSTSRPRRAVAQETVSAIKSVAWPDAGVVDGHVGSGAPFRRNPKPRRSGTAADRARRDHMERSLRTDTLPQHAENIDARPELRRRPLEET